MSLEAVHGASNTKSIQLILKLEAFCEGGLQNSRTVDRSLYWYSPFF